MLVLYLLCIKLAKNRKDISKDIFNNKIEIIKSLSNLIKKTLNTESDIQMVCNSFVEAKGSMFLGRGYSFPIALEGALKLKELSICSC